MLILHVQHIRGTRHRKFARNEDNYIELDYLLRRLERKPVLKDPSPFPTPDSDDQDEPSDACLGPGDYFYDLQMDEGDNEQNACASRENDDEDDDGHEENLMIPRIIVDEDDS
jgi:regulatory subunit for Cdc7p protein kinase